MGKVSVRYLNTKRYKGKEYLYWQPKDKYLVGGEWKKCPYPARRINSVAEAQELYVKLKEWRDSGEAVKHEERGTVDWLITEYRKDAKFKNLSINTQKLYLGHFKDVSKILGDFPVEKVSRKSARAFCTSFIESRKPSAIASTCRVLFNHARDMGILQVNPFTELRIPKPKARRAVWDMDSITKVIQAAEGMGLQSIAHATLLGIYTAQRPGDLRKSAWHDYDGQWLRIRQGKTGAVVDIPTSKIKPLKSLLDGMERVSPVILIYEATGKPYSKEMLCGKFREACDKAGIGAELQFRDFRRTTVVVLGEAGLSAAEIAAITGHDIGETTKILDVYLPRNRKMTTAGARVLNRLKVGKTTSTPVSKVGKDF